MEKIERRSFSKEERLKILCKTDSKCAHCGAHLTHNTMTIEHIFPLHKGGTHDEFNVVALCYDCNQSKSNMLYRVTDYYKHILPEYLPNYIEQNAILMNEYSKHSNKVMKFDTKIYKFLPYKHKEIVYNMVKRKTKKEKINKVLKNLYVKLTLERAYEADASEIYQFIEYLQQHKELTLDSNFGMCENEMKILNIIRFGDAYVLRSNNNICGAFLFINVSGDLGIPQLTNIIETTNLEVKHIMVFGYVNVFAQEVYNDIMEDIFMQLVLNNVLPIYFNILDKMYMDKNAFINMAYQLEGVDGTLEFFTMKNLEQNLKNILEDMIEYDNELGYVDLTDERKDDVIQQLLYGNPENVLATENSLSDSDIEHKSTSRKEN